MIKNQVLPKSCLKPLKWISWQTYEDKTYIIDERSEALIKLGGSASIFWISMLNYFKIEDILRNLENTFYDVDKNELQQDMYDLINDLIIQEILEVE